MCFLRKETKQLNGSGCTHKYFVKVTLSNRNKMKDVKTTLSIWMFVMLCCA